MIYLDNAATTLRKPQQVIDAVVNAMTSMGNSSRGTHDQSIQASMAIFQCRCKLMQLFHAPSPDRVVFTQNSTEALNIAINGLIQAGDHVITSDLEHNSVLRPLYRLEQEQNVELSFVAADKKGCINYDDFEALIRPNTKAIICTHASNLTGNILDVKRIGKIAEKHGLLFIVDASQTAGVFPIDMAEMNISVLCFTGHKGLMGPQGTGGLCTADHVNIRPWKVGGSGVQSYSKMQPAELPTALEAGTLNGHGIAGLSAALDFIAEVGVDAIHQKEIALMQQFYDAVRQIDGVTVYGDFSTTNRCAIVALNIHNYESSAVSDVLAVDYDIATRPGAHCAPRMHQALETTEQGAVRFSFSIFNTEEEVKSAVDAVRCIAQQQ